MPATVVLVHGAWHGAWCFDRVLPLVRDAGIDVIAVDLPGHGADPRPFGDLHGDAASVTAVLEGIDEDVVLLGHSYGGAVITEAGVHPNVRHLVYLAAFALGAEESCNRAAADQPGVDAIAHAGRPDMGTMLRIDEHGVATISPEGAAACFYNDCDDETVDWAVAHLGRQPMVVLRQSPTAIAWIERPSTYVVCADDMCVHPDLQRILARRCSDAVEWPTSHSPFLSRPDLVAQIITDLAAEFS